MAKSLFGGALKGPTAKPAPAPAPKGPDSKKKI